MLDWLESWGIDCDSLDSGQSLRLHARLFPSARPQSICITESGTQPEAEPGRRSPGTTVRKRTLTCT
jgi:hypothetical protein